MKYQISDIVIETSVELPQLIASVGRGTDLIFKIDDLKSINYKSYQPFRDIHLQNRQLWLSIGKFANEYLLKFPGTCDFIISATDKIISCFRRHSSINTVRYLLLNHVIPLYLSSSKKFLLHCSAVSINNRAVLFIGDSTSGKSTLAASFCNAGYTLLSDDFLLIREDRSTFVATPSYPSVRLHPDAISQIFGFYPTIFKSDVFGHKQWIKANGNSLPYSEKECAIKNIYLLKSNNDISLNSIRIMDIKPSESLVELLNNSFIIDSSDRELLENNMDFCARLVKEVPVKKLAYKKDYKVLPEVIKMILSDKS